MSDNAERTVVLVSSCDRFADCWKPFAKGLANYWPDCHYPVRMISNTRTDKFPGLTLLPVGPDRGWADNLRAALETLDCDYVIYLQEDYWLIRRVDPQLIEAHLHYCRKNQVDYLRLAFPYFDQCHIDGTIYSRSPESSRYRICLQAAIWKRSTLLAALAPGWNGWDFEFGVNARLKAAGLKVDAQVILMKLAKTHGFQYVFGTAVHKGRWTRAAVNYLRRCGYAELIAAREVEGAFYSWLDRVRTPGLRLPAALLVRVMNRLKLNF